MKRVVVIVFLILQSISQATEIHTEEINKLSQDIVNIYEKLNVHANKLKLINQDLEKLNKQLEELIPIRTQTLKTIEDIKDIKIKLKDFSTEVATATVSIKEIAKRLEIITSILESYAELDKKISLLNQRLTAVDSLIRKKEIIVVTEFTDKIDKLQLLINNLENKVVKVENKVNLWKGLFILSTLGCIYLYLTSG
jgi:DNA repair exonuclease SbcCD ATPase subunit